MRYTTRVDTSNGYHKAELAVLNAEDEFVELLSERKDKQLKAGEKTHVVYGLLRDSQTKTVTVH